MPAKKGIWLDDQGYLFPIPETASKNQKLEAIAPIKPGTLDLALEHQESVRQESIFGEQLYAAEG